MSARPRDDTEGVGIRAATADDRAALEELLDALVADHHYGEQPSSHLAIALDRPEGDEARVLVAERGSEIVGLSIDGFTAGAIGAGRITFVGTSVDARRRGIARALVRASIARLSRDGARFICIEMPSEPSLAPAVALFASEQFVEEGRVRDLYRDGVDQVLLVRRLSATAEER